MKTSSFNPFISSLWIVVQLRSKVSYFLCNFREANLELGSKTRRDFSTRNCFCLKTEPQHKFIQRSLKRHLPITIEKCNIIIINQRNYQFDPKSFYVRFIDSFLKMFLCFVMVQVFEITRIVDCTLSGKTFSGLIDCWLRLCFLQPFFVEFNLQTSVSRTRCSD